jgi:rhodanese-related sulfurtransferase
MRGLKGSATFGGDIAAVLGLALVCLLAGLTINRFSAQPLPHIYQSPDQRLQAELAELVAAPPFASFPVDTVDLDQFRSAVSSHDNLILDARSSSYYDDGHVPGARNLSRDRFSSDYVRLRPMLEKDKDRPILVYCSGGACHDSKMVAQALTSLGFSNVKIFAGGWSEWSAAHLPADHGATP